MPYDVVANIKPIADDNNDDDEEGRREIMCQQPCGRPEYRNQ